MQANLARVLSREERAAALTVTLERFLGVERKEKGQDATLTVILESVPESEAPALPGVVYATHDVLRIEAARGGPVFYLALGAPAPAGERDAIEVPIERRAVPADPSAEDGLIETGECVVKVASGAPAFIAFCHYDAGHGGD
jgi:hypothetical protein